MNWLSLQCLCPHTKLAFQCLCPHTELAFRYLCPHTKLVFRCLYPHTKLAFRHLYPHTKLAFQCLCPDTKLAFNAYVEAGLRVGIPHLHSNFHQPKSWFSMHRLKSHGQSPWKILCKSVSTMSNTEIQNQISIHVSSSSQ